MLTQLASDRVVGAAADSMGIKLDADQIRIATQWVKSEAFRRGEAVVPPESFRVFTDGLLAQEPTA